MQNPDEIMVNHRLQFSDSLKDLKKLRKQLYSAADYFESSYNRDNHKQFVMDSSKDYVSKALVSTVDHLGSLADKLNKFLDQKANQYSATTAQFSCINQRLNTIQKLFHSRALSQHLLKTGNNILSLQTLELGKSNALSRNTSVPFPDDVQRPKQARMKSTSEASPNPVSFSFTNIPPNKEAGRRSVSPLRLPFNLIGSKRSVSPSPSINKAWKLQQPPEPRRAISACRRREMISKEMEMEAYTKKSKHLLKALLSLHHSRKALVLQK